MEYPKSFGQGQTIFTLVLQVEEEAVDRQLIAIPGEEEELDLDIGNITGNIFSQYFFKSFYLLCHSSISFNINIKANFALIR